jgi:putative ABC transport system permease protein
MWNDLKLALRTIRSQPGFSLVVLITLAVGIGANTAIFTVVDAVVLRPLPYRDPQRLYYVFPTNPKDGGKDRLARLAEVDLLNQQLRSLGPLAVAGRGWEAMISDEHGQTSPIKGTTVSANLFDVVGITPLLGRVFTAAEDVEGGPRVAVLSHAAWLRRFGGDPGVLGRNLVMGGRAAQVIGVLPPGVSFPDATAEVLLPARQVPAVRRWRLLTVVGRLKDGASEGEARAELATAARRLEAEFPDVNAGMGLRLVRLQDELTSETRPTLLLLLGAVGLVLLIACANVANLMLARGLARRGEIAVRVALGASRLRLLQQLMTEGLVLALTGGALGVGLARWGVDLAISRSPVLLPGRPSFPLDGRVLAFSLVVSLVTALLCALAPAWHLLRSDPGSALRAQGRGATPAGQRRLSRAMVVAEVALALVLLVGAGLLVRTVGRLLALDPGFVTRNLLTLKVHAPPGPYDQGKALAQNRALEERLRTVPGVVSVGQISRLPLATVLNVLQALEVQGRPVPAAQRPSVDVRYVTTDYFRTMGIPLIAGRLITEQDTELVLINQAAARRFWPGQVAIGQVLRTASSSDPPSPWHTVTGVVGDIRHLSLDAEPRAEVYFYAPVEQRVHLVLRTAADPTTTIPAVRAAILQVDPRLGITNVETIDGLMLDSIAPRRFGMWLLGLFAALALLLAALGLYGVMSYSVAQRRKEIGVRMALGADQHRISRMVVREGMALVLAGAVLGLAGALALARLMSRLLFGVSPFDPATFAAVFTLLALAALLACALAARRATRVDPMVALRES